MTGSLPAVQSIGSVDGLQSALMRSGFEAAVHAPRGASFSQMLLGGIDQVDQQLVDADAKIASFALDDAMPPHEVLFAIEQARHSLELLLQVRSRLVEGYQEIMRMQL